MRIAVISDSHRMMRVLYKIVETHIKDADLFIFLGDIDDDFDNVLMLYPKLKYYRVAGNNDWYSTYPFEQLIEVGGKRIFFAHGHTYYVKRGYNEITDRARELGADICLFGHTHTQYTNYDNGLYIMNPGAVCAYKYGMIDITETGIMLIPAECG